MNFRTVATLGAAVTLPFGLLFLLLPGQAGALYGNTSIDAYTLYMGRLFGTNLLLFAGALWGLRGLRDAGTQRSVAVTLTCLTALGTAVTTWGVVLDAVNAVGWSSVAVYGMFILAWGRLAWAESEPGEVDDRKDRPESARSGRLRGRSLNDR